MSIEIAIAPAQIGAQRPEPGQGTIWRLLFIDQSGMIVTVLLDQADVAKLRDEHLSAVQVAPAAALPALHIPRGRNGKH